MTRGVLASLRDLVPLHPLTPIEALRVAELQATRLLEASRIKSPPVPESVISGLPKIEVRRISPWPVSGCTDWVKSTWVIVVNGAEPPVRQRFSLAHEFKHIVDHRFVEILYPPTATMASSRRAETVCDYFAGCLLVPSAWLLDAWTAGCRNFSQLARHFEVSQAAIYVRLQQIGLAVRQPRCNNDNPIIRSRLRSLQKEVQLPKSRAQETFSRQAIFDAVDKAPSRSTLSEDLFGIKAKTKTDHHFEKSLVGPSHREEVVDLDEQSVKASIAQGVSVGVKHIAPARTVIAHSRRDHGKEPGNLRKGLVQPKGNRLNVAEGVHRNVRAEVAKRT
jgi:hypothetical protein